MVVRIRFVKGPSPGQKRARNQRMAAVFATLLQPPAVAALALALWSIAASFKWVGTFAFDRGLLSHWQTWMAAAVAIWFCASALNRYGNRYGKDGGQAAV
jgi:hypothetical protein